MDPGSEIHLDIHLKPAHDRSLPASKFLVPEGYVGWLRVEYDSNSSPGRIEDFSIYWCQRVGDFFSDA